MAGVLKSLTNEEIVRKMAANPALREAFAVYDASFSESSVMNDHIPARDGQWAKHYFPDRFSRPFTQYQKDLWNWAETINPDDRVRPRIECEPRGVGKSSNARAVAVYLLARKIKSYVLYVCATVEQAQKHFNAIKAMLETPALLRDYPHLRPKAQTHRSNVNKQWSSERLVTDAGQVVEFLSLLSNARGFTTEEGKRPDAMFLDDIDDSKDSPHMVSKKLDILRTSIIPAKAENTVFLFPQNLIHRNSICQMVYDQRADILSDRIFVGPFKLLKWYEAERVDLHDGTGAKIWKIKDGELVDEAIPLSYCEALLNDGGIDSFEREVQQDVFRIGADKDFREWSETHHIITFSEFRDFFARYGVTVWDDSSGHPVIPHNWNVGLGLDFGTTPEHPAAVACIARPSVTAPLSDSFFVFGEVILPSFPLPVGESPEPVSPGRVAQAVRDKLSRWKVAEKQVTHRLMSHEQSAAMNTMRLDLADDLKTFFNKWKARKGSGVPQLQELLAIDRVQTHPFRVGVTGRPRIYFIVPDEQGRLISTSAGMRVAQPVDSNGFIRARFEMPLYSQFNSGQEKIDDDFVDAARGLLAVFALQPQNATFEELVEKHLPPAYLQPPAVNTPADELSRIFARREAIRKAQAEQLSDTMTVFDTLDF